MLLHSVGTLNESGIFRGGIDQLTLAEKFTPIFSVLGQVGEMGRLFWWVRTRKKRKTGQKYAIPRDLLMVLRIPPSIFKFPLTFLLGPHCHVAEGGFSGQ